MAGVAAAAGEAESPPPRLSRRIGDLLWLPLAGLMLFELLSGVYLFLKQEPDLKVYAFLKIHIRTGLVVAVLLVASSTLHLTTRRYRFFAAATLLLSLGAVPFVIYTVNWVPPGASVGTLTALALALGWWVGAPDKKGAGSQRIAGLAWASLVVASATGIYLGVFKGLGTISNVVHYFHLVAALLGCLLLFLHSRSVRTP